VSTGTPPRDAATERSGIGRTVLADLRQGDVHRSLWRDLQDTYLFYLDDEERARLRSMSRLQRSWKTVWWVLKSLVLNLSPARRILLISAIGAFAWGIMESAESWAVGGFVLALLVLLFELRDKLLARNELEVGRAVQLALLPATNPEVPGWEIWLHSRPANDVGGDLLDYLGCDDGRLHLALGDVAGKGLGAALLAAKLQATLRALATDAGSLTEIAGRTNRILCRDGLPNRFATLLYLELRADDGHVRLLNAGHMPPLHAAASGIETLPPVALPIGIRGEAEFEEQSLEVGEGEILLLYSDGLSEAVNEHGQMFGDDGVRELFGRVRGFSAPQAGAAILEELARFVGESRPFDDMSLAILRRLPSPSPTAES
jgi:sigma-B regulation protein RsbU (phosphoserine phosphatase)